VHTNAVRALKPGGLAILEAFRSEQLPKTSGGPKDPTMLYNPAMLRADFAGLEILELTVGTVSLSEGDKHRGDGEVVRLVARKPG